jgi:signal transduction histidine kinase
MAKRNIDAKNLEAENIELRKQLYEARSRAGNFESILKSMPSPAWIVDEDHHLLYLNPAFERMVDIETGDWTAKPAAEVLSPDVVEMLGKNNQQVLESGRTVSFVESLETGESLRQLLAYKFPLVGDGRKHIGGVSFDISHQVSDEEMLRQQIRNLERSNAVRDRLLSVIAHDVRAPLAILAQLARLLESEVDTMQLQDLKQNLDHIRSSAENTQNIIGQLLRWVRSQDQQLLPRFQALEPVRIIEANWNLLSEAAQAKNIAFRNSVDRAIRLAGDSNMFGTAIRNLLSNAIKFTENGGTIRVEAEPAGEMTRISVVDDGVGMSAETLEKIRSGGAVTSTWGTNREAGSGLGLSLVRDFTRKQGGSFHAESNPGSGSRLSLDLPAIRKNDELYHIMYQSEATAEMDLVSFQQLRIEFAEKNRDNILTGLLVMANGKFLQLIEGHRLIAESLYETIGKDSRNRNCIKLYAGVASQRLFPGQAMQTFVPESSDGNGATAEFSVFLEKRCINVEEDVCQLLLSFFSSMFH